MTPSTRRPSAGARYVLERVGEAKGSVVYRGFVHLPDADVPIEVVCGEGVSAQVEADAVPAGGPEAAALARVAAALVRTAVRAAAASARTPPRRITRWRGGA